MIEIKSIDELNELAVEMKNFARKNNERPMENSFDGILKRMGEDMALKNRQIMFENKHISVSLTLETDHRHYHLSLALFDGDGIKPLPVDDALAETFRECFFGDEKTFKIPGIAIPGVHFLCPLDN